MKQIMAKKFTPMSGLPERFTASFGSLTMPFIGIIWGASGNGKTNFLMQVMHVLAQYGRVMYVSLEEGHEVTIQQTLARHFDKDDALAAKISIADHTMRFEALCEALRRRRSPQFIIIDSLQYWNISADQYRQLKEEFRRKSFLFISHAKGKEPAGTTAYKIRYDAGLKIRVEGYIAFVVSRYGGNQPYIIWEEGARKYWGKQYRKHTAKPKA